MIRTGKVIDAQGENLQICFSRPGACESCGMCGGGRNDSIATLQGQAVVGDWVEVEMPDAQVLKISLITYLVPLLGLLVGLWLGTVLFPGSEAAVMATGLILLALAFGGVKLIDRRLGRKAAWKPRLLRVIPEPQAEQEPDEEKPAD